MEESDAADTESSADFEDRRHRPTRRGSAAGAPDAPIDVRADFDALAVFAPDELTGADGTVTVRGRPARQSHPLPGDGRRRRRRRPVRFRRVGDHRPAADQRAALRASVLELRRPLRTPGGGPEPDRRTRRRRRGARGRQPRTDRRSGPTGHRARQRSHRGALPGIGGRGRHRPFPCRIGQRRIRRRRRSRPARLHPGDRRGIRHLRRGRRARPDRPTAARSDRRVPAVRRARDLDVVDRTAGAHRRRAVPLRIPVRLGRRVRLTDHGGCGTA